MYVRVEFAGDGIVVAIDHDIPGCVDFEDSLGNEKPQVFLLLNQFGRVIRFDGQDQRVGLVQCLQGTFQLTVLPECLGGLAKIQSFVQLLLHVRARRIGFDNRHITGVSLVCGHLHV